MDLFKKILGISNSASQRDYIISQAKKRNLNNIEIETVDMNKFETNKKYDMLTKHKTSIWLYFILGYSS